MKCFAAQHESVRGTNRTWCDVRSESAFRGKAEIRLAAIKLAFDPNKGPTL
jgi:hypothetical protein